MPVILKLDSKPTLFEVLEVEVDGRKYKLKEFTLGSLEKIQELQPDLQAGSAAAIRRAFELLLDGKTEHLKDLPLKKVRILVETLVQRAMSPTDEEKNGPGPGAG